MNGSELIQFAIDTLKADSNYADVDMSESSAFYNLVILPFSVLAKSVFDLNASNLDALKLSTMSSSQLDDYGTLFFATRRSQNLLTLEVSIYLTNSTNTTEPLVIYTSDQFRTSQNQIFNPIQDYIFSYNTLPTDPTGQYKIATIITSSSQNYTQILENTITTSTILHPLLQFVTNTKASSSPISAETDEEFINTIQKAISQRSNLTSDSLYTNIKTAFPQITDSLAIGYGDPEMQRDIAVAGKAWSGHFGGMTDIYVRTPVTPVTITATATRNATSDGYTFTLQKYKGYDWNSIDTSSPNSGALMPWTLLTSPTATSLPVVLIDWENSSITNTTFKTNTNNLINYKIDVMPDPDEKSYGKNYRYSPYENIKITVYTNTATNPTETITFKYSTLTNIEDIQTYINSSENRILCSNNLIKSFIPIEIKDLNITYDSRYYVDETTWASTLADIINTWSLPEPIRLSTLIKDFPAPVRIDEIWYDANANPNLPYSIDSTGQILGSATSASSYPSYATMVLNNIDGSYKYYLSTRQIYPFVSNGLSSTYRTCRYFIDINSIKFTKGSW